MGLNIGIKELKVSKLGTINISSIWLGDDKLWPTIVYYKFQAEYSDGTSYDVECDGNGTLGTDQTKPSGYDSSTMTEAIIGDCVSGISSSSFERLINLSSVTMSSSVTQLGDSCFSRCVNLSNITISENITSIGDYCFNNCTSLSNITLPTGITYLGGSCFYKCSSLSSIIIPSNVRSIGASCFGSCSSLSSVTIPSSVTYLGSACFGSCSSLSSVTIPSSVTSIGSNAFAYCTSLKSITVEAVSPPTLGTNAFTNTHNCPIYVPCDSVDAYKAASVWSTYASRIQPISGTCLDCNWNQYQAEDAEPHNPTYAARFHYDVDVSNGYFIDFTDGALGYLSIVRDTNSQTWKVVTSSGETPITFVNDVGTVKFKDFGFETMEIDSMSLFNGIPFDIELCEKSLQWVTFNNGDTIPNDLDIYGFSGTAENLSYTFGYGSALGFTQTRNKVDYVVYCNGGATCWSDYGILQSSIIEEIISDHNCSCDCVNQGATVSGTINLYIYN